MSEGTLNFISLCKKNTIKNYIIAIIIGISLITCTILLTDAYKKRNNTNNTISVTGLGSTDFVSDLII